MEQTAGQTEAQRRRRSVRCRYGASAVLGALALGVTTLWLAAPAGWTQAQSTEQHSEEMIAAGKTVFSLNCSNEFCHGPRGGGNFMGEANAQKLTDDVWFHGDGSHEFIVKILHDGIPGTPMISWTSKLGEEKIQQVAAFVKTLSAK